MTSLHLGRPSTVKVICKDHASALIKQNLNPLKLEEAYDTQSHIQKKFTLLGYSWIDFMREAEKKLLHYSVSLITHL